MKYKAYLIQAGEGCDYTIGCGRAVIDINAFSVEEAILKLEHIVATEFTDDSALDHVELYEISQVFIMPVKDIYERRYKAEADKHQKEVEKAERLEYERLKKIYS